MEGAGENKCWLYAALVDVAGIGAHTGHSKPCLGIAPVTKNEKEWLAGAVLTSSHALQAGPAGLESSSRPLLSRSRLRCSKKGWKGEAVRFPGLFELARWKAAREAAAGDSLPDCLR